MTYKLEPIPPGWSTWSPEENRWCKIDHNKRSVSDNDSEIWNDW